MFTCSEALVEKHKQHSLERESHGHWKLSWAERAECLHSAAGETLPSGRPGPGPGPRRVRSALTKVRPGESNLPRGREHAPLRWHARASEAPWEAAERRDPPPRAASQRGIRPLCMRLTDFLAPSSAPLCGEGEQGRVPRMSLSSLPRPGTRTGPGEPGCAVNSGAHACRASRPSAGPVTGANPEVTGANPEVTRANPDGSRSTCRAASPCRAPCSTRLTRHPAPRLRDRPADLLPRTARDTRTYSAL